MQKRPETDLTREDFVNALKEMNTFVDVAVDDLLELNSKAAKYARYRKTESLRIGNLMSRSVVTITPDTSLAEAAHLLVTHRISGLPVVDAQQHLLGVITEADFLRAMGVPSHHPTHSLWQTLEAMFTHQPEIREPTGTVADLMVENVITVKPEQTLHDVIAIMKHNRIKRVVVCDDDGRVQGMVTRSDLVRVFFDRLRRTQPSAE
ncbi:MAG: CBS domain-containing protein [Gammaproteobacteria bacterium]|nr:CBS domain-containing protein [Gammaproteobacteria bacterium]